MTKEDYYWKLERDILSRGVKIIGGLPADAAAYFQGHKPRFDAQVEMWNKFLDMQEIELVYDLGTSVPFTSYYFNVTKDAEVVYGMLEDSGYRVSDKVYPIILNLCKEHGALRQADLVICTECLEHLGCNLYKVREFLKSAVKPGKYMLLSFPCGGQNAKDYWRDCMADYDRASDLHVREFTLESAREFAWGTGWDILEERITTQEAYAPPILNVLMRRPA